MWRRFSKTAAGSSTAGFSADDSCVAYARVRHPKTGRLQVLAASVDKYADNDEWALRLAQQVGAVYSAGPPVTSSLPNRAYQLLQIEQPSVPPAEARDAVRWQIKDLLDYPVEETVVEICDMPARSSGSDEPAMAYAVASRRSNIEDHIGLLKRAGLSPNVISIPELCARNIATMLPQDAIGVAFLHLTEDHGILTVSRQGVLYLVRHIERGRRALRAAAEGFERDELITTFVLEVQRSLDYYESHFDRRPLTELVIAPGSDVGGLSDALSEQLDLTVSGLDLSDLFDLENAASPEDQGACLLAIGAALRQHQHAA